MSPSTAVTPLVAAVLMDDLDAITSLIKQHGHDVDEGGGGIGRTAACVSAFKGRRSALRRLHECGADLDRCDDQGHTPAWWASREGHSDSLAYLRDQGCNLDAADHWGRTPAIIAVLNNNWECLAILKEAKVDLNRTDLNGRTPASVATASGHTDCLKMLLEAHVDLSVGFGLSGEGSPSALQVALQSGHTECADLIRTYTTPRPKKSAAKRKPARLGK